jgi:hypothetical protein
MLLEGPRNPTPVIPHLVRVKQAGPSGWLSVITKLSSSGNGNEKRFFGEGLVASPIERWALSTTPTLESHRLVVPNLIKVEEVVDGIARMCAWQG